MSQGMDDKIRQISEMLSSPEAQDGIRQLFSSIGAPRRTTQGDTQSPEGADSEHSLMEAPIQQSSPESDWVYKIQNILNQVNSVQDSRVNLLRSVHPFLNQNRRDRCSTCINILQVADILKALTNNSGRFL